MEPLAKGHESSVTQRPMLDPSSFEKLLAAAWVLQCQTERKALRLSVVSSPLVAKAATAVAPTNERVSVPPLAKVSASREVPSVVSTTEVPRITPASLTLRSDWKHAWRGTSQALLDAIPDFRSLADSWRSYHVKITITPSSRRAAVAACLPSLILAVILAFALSEISRQGHEVAAATSPARDFQAGVGNAKAGSVHTGNADAQAFEQSTPIGASPASHKRITDLEVLSVVNDLSPHEIRVLRWQAEGGDDSAALTMGMLYETGHYVPQNCRAAADWVAKAANGGNAAAEYNLGLRYREGDGVLTDEHQAQQWLQKAADQNYSQAMAALKEMVASGF